MKNINDTRIYLLIIGISFFLALLIGFVYIHSAFFVEPDIKNLIYSEDNLNGNLKNAYVKLKSPHIFARYENFDRIAMPIKTIIKVYDKKLENNESFDQKDKVYLQLLLDRREQGSVLSRNTMIFFFILCFIGLMFYLNEKRQIGKYS